ncbi:hypothetical protein PPYR_09093 [Photinus pyralis]|uniref:Protein krueppel n=2 Tax=Photinus pyralis TaxID=7054 RepID=A0A5N4AL81_PHOPY|nr:endothelial zinc finger protein induced by tumor necrosis factor alpha-like isoform X1 [Photinus pyralis]KAB0798100.1 hypothetical protein PPYR_09093 [Photinus pyralis]
MKMEIILQIPKDLNKLCRTCMSLVDDEPQNFLVFQNEETELSKILQTVTSLKIFPGDGLPTNLCSVCVQHLNSAFTFINQCTEVDNNLQKILRDAYSSDSECVEILDTTSSIIKFPSADFCCRDCNSQFTSYYELSMHMMMHSEKRSLTERFMSNFADDKHLVDLKPTLTDNTSLIDETRNHLKVSNSNYIEINVEPTDLLPGTVKVATLHSNIPSTCTQNQFQCDMCSEGFSSEDQLSSHILLDCGKTVEQKHICTLCSKEFDDLVSVSLHFLNHSLAMEIVNGESISGDVSFCDICGQIFENNALLRNHYQEYHKDREMQHWMCSVCAELFEGEKDLLTHILVVHFDDEVYVTEFKVKTQCVLCTERFSTRAELHSHSLIHLMKRYTCRKCSLQFCTQQSLFAHFEVHAGKKYECSLCGKFLSSRSALKSHKQGVHPNKLDHCCSICGKCFATFARLNTHSKIHTADKKYVCSYCGYKSHKSGDLVMHTRIHTSERPYKCTVPNCTMSFKTSSHLCHHVRRHFQIRKFKCDICATKFSTNHGLKIHQMLHTGEKPHLCIVCKKTFRRKYHLKVHMKQHVEHKV